MLGPSHALSGAAIGAWAPIAAPLALPPAEHAVFALATMAWSVWPDVDHHKASTAKGMWGPVSAGPAHVLGRLTGGHRGGTHHIAAAALAAGAVWLSSAHPVALGVAYALTVGMSLAALDAVISAVRLHWVENLLVSVLGAALLVGSGVGASWLPWAVALGVVAHIAGDRVRVGGLGEGLVCRLSLAALIAIPLTFTG